MLGVHDLEKLQAAFPDHQMELVGGKVIVMSPSDPRSSEIAVRFAVRLAPYIEQRRLGRVTGADGGYVLPNGDLRAPDVAFTSYERLRSLPRSYAQATPEFVVEVRSSTDRRREMLEKIGEFLSLGSVAGVYVDPDVHEVVVMRNGREDEILHDGDVLRVTELFPDWQLDVGELWPPDAPEKS